MDKRQAESESGTGNSTLGLRMVGVRTSKEMIRSIKQLALNQSRSMQDVIIEALIDVLKKHGIKPPKDVKYKKKTEQENSD